MSVRSVGPLTARCGLVLAALAAPLVLHRTLNAGIQCPNTRDRVITCPDPHRACPQPPAACQGLGSVLQNGAWGCQNNGPLLTQCVNAIVPPGTDENNALCYTEYECWLNANGMCVPNTANQGQKVNKVIMTTEPCP